MMPAMPSTANSANMPKMMSNGFSTPPPCLAGTAGCCAIGARAGAAPVDAAGCAGMVLIGLPHLSQNLDAGSTLLPQPVQKDMSPPRELLLKRRSITRKGLQLARYLTRSNESATRQLGWSPFISS